MSNLNSTLDRIQKEIKESIQREKELKNGYSKINSDLSENINGNSFGNRNGSCTSIEDHNSEPLKEVNIMPLNKSNGFKKFHQNSQAKGVMHKFLKSRGRLSMPAISTNMDQSNWASDAAFKPAKMTVEKGGKPLRNGYVSAEEKMKKELQEFQLREAQLREERRKSQPNLMAALQLEEENEFENSALHFSGSLKPAKSMANLCNYSDDGFEDNSSVGGSLKPARSLAELCDVSDDESGLPGTHSLIMQFENMKFKEGSLKRSVPKDF